MPSDFVKNLVKICEEECDIFGDGAQKEYMETVYERVGNYWNALSKTPSFEHWATYNGRSEVEFEDNGSVDNSRNQPWSAAFISYVMRKAGAGDHFAYSSSHSTYIVRALKQAQKHTPTSAFIARRHKEYVPKLGDLIACERLKTLSPSFDTYPGYVAENKYQAHCDVVTEVHSDHIATIGGNVSDSVRRKSWPLVGHGMIDNVDPWSPTANVICIIENQL
ncbi:MAG: DUF2272 domain-containing protein [Candidatus Devosia phytovorans]|uniref:DUF2272 domain-containing protein n=1 Tax=Candidatus Devosia phytovorans TaxID=3121372 RepID=A0AAJ5VUD6_9HYPH|nr:DUF2272 domain-containing protein [Devosia sp.]WEK04321.1 MAG: DUF2272 domain-containing protein [Devosia sp.]